jgi:hypothetical protein
MATELQKVFTPMVKVEEVGSILGISSEYAFDQAAMHLLL